MSNNIQYSKICLILLGIVCAGALFARMEGIKWPKLHPDEPVIGAWIEQSAHSIYIRDRVYPNGFFALARPFVFAGRALVRAGERFAYTCGEIDRVRSLKPDGIYFGRWFNVWTGTLLCVIIFLLVSRMTRSQWTGLFAACLIGFAQYAVEHSHYAETDMAAVLTLTFALWLWVVAGDTVRRCWFIAAALASGFAAGTKFTLLVLVPVVLVETVLFTRRRFPVGWWRALEYVCFGLLLFGAGFVVANPAVVLDFKWFWVGLAAEKQRVFAETALNLGPLGVKPTVKYLHHFWCLYFNMQTLGYPWIVLIAAGLPCAVLGVARRYWTVSLLFPLLYAVYWFFMAPWVRSQEFLLFLPSFTALAAIPLIVLWRTNFFLRRALALLCAVLAISASGYNGLRVSALFGWQDTRLMAREWLQPRLPLESTLAAESYAEAACIDTCQLPLSINKIERYGIVPLVDQGADYLLRSAGISGRGLHNPLTGELYPEPARLFQQFVAGSELLCAWAPLTPRGFATFISPAIELYGLKHFTPAVSLPMELAQPALIVNGDQNPVGRQTFFPTGHGLGCAVCLLVDRLPQTIAVGGPGSLAQPVFLVLNTAERPAVIHVRGFGMDKKVALDPYDTRMVPLKRSPWRPCAKSFETITLQADPVEDVLYIPCFARIAFTVDEVARICLETARGERIKEYFPEELLEKELSPDLKFIIASELKSGTMADRNKQPADSLRNEIEKCLQAGPAAVSVNGVSGYYYEQFARARLQPPYEFACGPQRDEYTRAPLRDAVKILDLQLPEEREGGQKINHGQKPPEYFQNLTLPILLARGKYELRGAMMLRLKENKTGSAVPLTVLLAGETGAVSKIELQPGKWRDFAMVLQPGREIQPGLDFRAPAAARLYLKNMEVCWSLSNVLASARAGLAVAAIRHSIQQADWAKAAAQLAALPKEDQAANELEIRQMMFACADGLKDEPGRRQAARRLLELAPGHYLSLLALAVEDVTAGEMARQMAGKLKNPPLFAPWLVLVGFSFNPGTREARCVFEVLRNETPGLAVTFCLQRRGEWRRKQVQSLTTGLSGIASATTEARLSKGERVAIVVRLNDAFGQVTDLNKLALGIETDVLWHAGAIPLASGGEVVPFARLGE